MFLLPIAVSRTHKPIAVHVYNNDYAIVVKGHVMNKIKRYLHHRLLFK